MPLAATKPICTEKLEGDARTTRAETRSQRLVGLEGPPDPAPAEAPSLVIRVGTEFSTAVRTEGERQVAFRLLKHGPVMLAASQAAAARANGSAAARVMRAAARQVAERARLEVLRGTSCPLVGTAGIARAVIRLGSAGGTRATLEQVHGATDTLASTWVDGTIGYLPHAWAKPMMVGSAVLGAILECLGATEIAAEAEVPREGTIRFD